MEQKLHKVGKYGSEETNRDENFSKECAREIYKYHKTHDPIKGYRYVLLEDGVSENLYYKRDGVIFTEGFNARKIVPDVPTIILVENDNTDNFYIVLSGDDKFQTTGGNAIERTSKNLRVFEDKLCHNSDINPYAILCSGSSFFNEDGTPNDYFASKFRQMFPYLRNGKPYIWQSSDEHNSHKKMWNQLYLKKDRFTKDEKMEILKTVASQSIKYYKSVLNV